MATAGNNFTGTSLQGFASLLVKLHSLIAEGKGDSEEADQLRDLMDTPWYGLTENQVSLARQLSRDLYTLHPGIPSSHPKIEVFAESLVRELAVARQGENWVQALRLLEIRASEVDLSRATTLRGSCYQHLGLTEIALLFFERAAELSSSPSGALIYLLTTLESDGKRATAAKRARSILKQNTQDVELQRLCALVILGEARESVDGVSHDGVLEAQAEFEKVRRKLETSGHAVTHQSLKSLVECYFSLAECAYLLGKLQGATELLSHALRLSPDDEPSLVFRGLLTLDRFQLARVDFLKAVQIGTRDPWPYYYLTHDSFRAGQYDKTLRYAEAGLRCTRKQELASEFHELLAMSLFMTNKDSSHVPADDIRRHFGIAIAQSPLNVHASVNSDRFEAFNARRTQPTWEMPKPWDIRAADIPRSMLERFHADLLIAN